MEVVDDVLDGNALLEQVDPDNRDIFREIFLNDDSDEEFLGFDPEDLENDEGTIAFQRTLGFKETSMRIHRSFNERRRSTLTCQMSVI